MNDLGTLAFLAFVVGWTLYIRKEWSYDGVERRLDRERLARKKKERAHLKVVDNEEN